jgi:hypothetical protein
MKKKARSVKLKDRAPVKGSVKGGATSKKTAIQGWVFRDGGGTVPARAIVASKRLVSSEGRPRRDRSGP